MKYVFSLPDRVSQALQQELTYPPFTPSQPPDSPQAKAC